MGTTGIAPELDELARTLRGAHLRRWTLDEVFALGDRFDAVGRRPPRMDLIGGELLVEGWPVTPAPALPHQRIVFALAKLLDAYVEQHELGEVLLGPADVVLAEEDLVQPDIAVVALRPDGRRPQSWQELPTPLLVVEALSPSTARDDRMKKRPRYQQAGVAECWLVDHRARRVERWRPDDAEPELLDARLAWQPVAAAPPLVIDLAALFARALDR